MSESWLTLKHAAEYLSISERSIRNLIQRGRIQWAKPEGKFYFRKSWLDEFISNGMTTKHNNDRGNKNENS